MLLITLTLLKLNRRLNMLSINRSEIGPALPTIPRYYFRVGQWCLVQNQKLIKLSDDLSIAVSAARNINASYLTTFGDAIDLYQEDLSARLMNSSATRSLPNGS